MQDRKATSQVILTVPWNTDSVCIYTGKKLKDLHKVLDNKSPDKSLQFICNRG